MDVIIFSEIKRFVKIHIDWSVLPNYINRVHFWLDNTRAQLIRFDPGLVPLTHLIANASFWFERL